MVKYTRLTVTALAAILAFALFPAAAQAARLGSTPVTILSEGFEANTAPQYALSPGTDSAALWGPVTQSHNLGARGLWVAGSGGFLAAYPVNTRGRATFSVPGLAEYYSSALRFHYVQPSIGGGEAESGFVVNWSPTNSTDSGSRYGWPSTSTWRAETVDLADPKALHGTITRAAGTLSFFFYDSAEPAGTSPNGAGPTIDDVTVTGWKYGSVRDLVTQAAGDSVNLSWARPYRSTIESTLEERLIAYRVWRAPYGTSTWTELTASGPVNQTTLSTPRPTAGTQFVYVVQAWDSGGGYGQPVEQLVTLPVDPVFAPTLAPTLAQTISPTTVKYGASATAAGTLVLEGIPLEGVGVQLQYYSGGWKTLDTKLTDAAGKVVFSAKPINKSKTSFRLQFAGTGFDTKTGAAVVVTPRPYVGAPWKSTTARKNKSFTVRGTLNPRHTAGSSPVKLRFYRWNGKKYVYKKSYTAKAYNYSTYSRYKASVKLPSSGTWRMRAYAPADSLHAASAWSSYTKFKVK